MIKPFIYFCVALITFVSVETSAKTKDNWFKNKFYVRGDIGVSIPANKFKNSNEDTDPYQIKKVKNTAVYNIGIGYNITNCIRSDLNFSYRDFIYKSQETDDALVSAVSQKIRLYDLFLNGYFDFNNINKIFKPYLTAGLGYEQNKSTTLLSRDTYGNRGDYPGTKKNNFIWNVGFGTRFVITNKFNLDISYRYIDLGTVKTKIDLAFPEEIPSSQTIKSHEITGGLIINL